MKSSASNNSPSIEQMSRRDVDVAVEWARREGWNPGVDDAECFFHADPEGFFAAKINGEIVGTVSVVKYSGDFAFEGLLIVKPEFRGQGIGAEIQSFVNAKFANLNLGLDAVLPMKEKYARAGFKFAHENIRYAGASQNASASSCCLPIQKRDFDAVVSFDEKIFPASRTKFLECWLFQKDAKAFLARRKGNGDICGYGVIRKCVAGHKIGPLFADDVATAGVLFGDLVSTARGEKVFLDVPRPNNAAVRLAEKHGMHAVFATARMYTKNVPALPLDQIFGITSFELS